LGRGERTVLHPGDGLRAATLSLGEREDVSAEVAVAALDVGEPVPLLVEDLDPQLVELGKALHQLGEGAGVEHVAQCEAALEARPRPLLQPGSVLSRRSRPAVVAALAHRGPPPLASQSAIWVPPRSMRAKISFRNSASVRPMLRVSPACSSIFRYASW